MLRKIVLNATYFSGLQAIGTPLFGGIGSILMLHHVRNIEAKPFSPNAHLSIAPEFLDALLGELSQDYDFVSMDEVARRMAMPSESWEGRPFLSVTLDDGYLDNIENAAPIFQKHNVPYMIYVAPNMVDGKSRIWWEDLENVVAKADFFSAEFPKGVRDFDCSNIQSKIATYRECMKYLFLEVQESRQREIVAQLCRENGIDDRKHAEIQIASWERLLKLERNDELCALGAHSMNHYVLAKLNETDLRYELNESRRILSEKTGKTIRHLAFPYGFVEAAGPREFAVAKELGFETAVTTRHGVLYEEHADHMTSLPRVSVNGNHQSLREMKTLLSGVPTRLKNYGAALDVA